MTGARATAMTLTEPTCAGCGQQDGPFPGIREAERCLRPAGWVRVPPLEAWRGGHWASGYPHSWYCGLCWLREWRAWRAYQKEHDCQCACASCRPANCCGGRHGGGKAFLGQSLPPVHGIASADGERQMTDSETAPARTAEDAEPRQWTMDDVNRSTVAERAAAIRAGQLRDLGVPPF